jgi:hypothetical protein
MSLHLILLAGRQIRDAAHGLYSYIKEYLGKGHSVLYTAERKSARLILRPSKDYDLRRYIKSGSLKVIYREAIFSKGRALTSDKLFKNLLESVISSIQKEKQKHVIAVGSHRHLSKDFKLKQLIKYERSLSKLLKKYRLFVCCYTQKYLAALSASVLINLVSCHTHSLHKGCVFRPWQEQDIIRIIGSGIDAALGSGMSRIILKTLKMVYKMDTRDISPAREDLRQPWAGCSADGRTE